MRNAVLISLLAVPLLSVAAPPTGAHPPGKTYGAQGVYTHQHVDDMREDGYAGLTCGFSADGDATGIVIQDPNEMTGTVVCGPLEVLNSAGGTVNSVTMTIVLQLNNASHGGGGVARSSTTAGNTGILFDTISYQEPPDSYVFYCTSISWSSSKGGGSTVYDADSQTPGDQCDLATHADVT